MSELGFTSETTEQPAPVSVPAEQSANPAPETTEGAPAESKPQSTESDASKEVKKTLRGVQKRIDELTRRNYETEERAKQEIAYWRQQVEALHAQQQEAQRNRPAPKLEQFPDLETYTAEQAKFQAEQLINKRLEDERQAYLAQQQQAQQLAQRQAAQAQFEQALNARIAEAEKKYPDFREVVMSPDLPSIIGTPAFGAIWESNIGADVMYHIAKNPEKAHQLFALSPVGQIREIARIEAAIEAGRTASSAPPPPETVGGGKGNATKDPANMTYDEFVTWRRRSLAQKRR